MSSRKVYARLTINMILTVHEGVEVSDVLDVMDCNFVDTTGNATIEDTNIEHFEITESK